MRSPRAGGGILSFGRSRAKLASKELTTVNFDDVAGVEEAKEEVKAIIEFLKNPSHFQRLGGRIPRGVLLVGPPGTGKTYIAKKLAEHLAGSADRLRLVQFHPAYSYEDFVEGYRPAKEPFFTVILTIEPHEHGSRYVVRALHADREQRQKHEDMGFYQGWGTCLDQLLQVVAQSG